MYRYQILIEYVGTSYVGWQIQKNGNSIQKTIQLALSKILGKKIILYGSGRTDAGVHAVEQSAHFDIKNKIQNIDRTIKSLNFFLNNKMISIIKIKKKNINFHARHSAKKRIYLYIIQNRLSPSTINKDREWHIRKKLDINLIKKGAKKLIGTHDFSTFRASNCSAKSPIRTINGMPGNVISDDFEICCGEGSIKVLTIQREGKRVQKISEFLLGSQIKKGTNIA